MMFSSHILHDAELLCDRVAMIMKGKLVACGSCVGIDCRGHHHEVEMVIDRLFLRRLNGSSPWPAKSFFKGSGSWSYYPVSRAVDQTLEVIRSAKAKLVALTPHKASLEDLFIRKATGAPARQWRLGSHEGPFDRLQHVS